MTIIPPRETGGLDCGNRVFINHKPLRMAFLQKGMSVSQAACEAGISTKILSRLLQTDSSVTYKVASKLAKFFGADVIFLGKEPPKKEPRLSALIDELFALGHSLTHYFLHTKLTDEENALLHKTLVETGNAACTLLDLQKFLKGRPTNDLEFFS